MVILLRPSISTRFTLCFENEWDDAAEANPRKTKLSSLNGDGDSDYFTLLSSPQPELEISN